MTSDDCSSCQRLRIGHNLRSHNCASSSTFPHSCLLLLLLLWLGFSSTLAAPQISCILCNKDDLLAKGPIISDSYEELTFDHQVTRQDAIQALRKYNETHPTQNSCNTMKCTPTVMKYCVGPQFLNDHCWCEMQHRDEGLPYVPHVCYVGEKVYKPSVGSCFFFEEVKECCCAPILVRECKRICLGSLNGPVSVGRHISGASLSTPKIFLSCLLALLSLLHFVKVEK
ncbi:hypothetical protein ACLKA7_014855 [Drosophila subpalustris]